MRILVYGAGVLGCNLARDFFKAYLVSKAMLVYFQRYINIK